MKIEHLYRDDCDTLRLLVNEFERLYERYTTENNEEINRSETHDASEYRQRKCIHNLKALLTSSLLIESQGLLDFYLPKIVEQRTKSTNLPLPAFDKTWKGGSVLEWLKHVLKEKIAIGFDFSREPYSRLKHFYGIRNDEVHWGGYLSEEKRRSNINKLNGIYVGAYTDLYVVDFSYCRSVIDDIEVLFLKVDESLR